MALELSEEASTLLREVAQDPDGLILRLSRADPPTIVLC